MPSTYRIHPAIGIARLGDSPSEFCLSPEKPASLPIACDDQGNPLLTPDGQSEVTVTKFKDAEGRIKRQAARFQIYVYDEESPEGRPLKLGDPIEGGGNAGTLVDIQWRVWVANKKAAWYEFDGLKGEHGYGHSHRLRNADITDLNARQQLIIDPGPRLVNATDQRRAAFDRDGGGVYATTFPPQGLTPNSIDTLGEILTDNQGRLLVLGGHGNSGSVNTGLGQPRIDTFANTDGWFDDTSDGPVMARLVMFSQEVGRQRYVDVQYPAWVITGYPRYVPEILDLVTVEDVVYDLAVRKFAYRTDIYGIPGTYDQAQHIALNDIGALTLWNAAPLDWNPDYKPWFYRDVWTILFRADEMTYLNNVLQQSNYPHNQTQRGNFDVTRASVPPMLSKGALERLEALAVAANQSGDLFLDAIQLKLEMFDDAVERALHSKVRAHQSADGGTAANFAGDDGNSSQSLFMNLRAVRAVLREEAQENMPRGKAVRPDYQDLLQAAAAKFATDVMPVGDKSPAHYLAVWMAANRRDDPAYLAAQQKLKHEVADALKPFCEATVSRWQKGLGKVAALAAFTQLGAGDTDPDKIVESVICSAIKAIEADAINGFSTGALLESEFHKALPLATNDPFRDYRNYLYQLLRQPGEENVFRTAGKPESRLFRLPLMPLLAGDSPQSNELPSKFLRLTDYQLYILRQWAEGKFYNEVDEGWVPETAIDPFQPYKNWRNLTGRDLDRGVLSNLLGGAFFPGGEICWVIRNPAIYKSPFRIKGDPVFYNFGQTSANVNQNAVPERDYLANIDEPLSLQNNFKKGLQPGDLTKYSALPWQADFNECTTEEIDITYELWGVIDASSDHDPWLKQEQRAWETLWWPAHRPLQAFEVVSVSDGKPNYQFLTWSRGVPQTPAGDLKMVTEWSRLGFVVRNPYLLQSQIDAPSPSSKYISVERNQEEP